MKNKLLILSLLFMVTLFVRPIYGQVANVQQNMCASELSSNRLTGLNTQNNTILNIIENSSQQSSIMEPLLTIPVVFHVLHLGEDEGVRSNISHEQIWTALSSLNDAFRGVVPYNSSYDVEMEFKLATLDPSGNPTTGINRVDASGIGNYATNGIDFNAGVDYNEDILKALSIWPNNEYYNIWIVNDIVGTNYTGITYIGPGHPLDGITIEYNAIGYDPYQSNLCVTGNGYNNDFIHQMGHGFGLNHDVLFNCNNFMADDPFDNCHPHQYFLSAQGYIMRDNAINYRSSLLTSSGLTPVIPIAEFNTFICGEISVCTGSSIQFNDKSFHDPTSWSWNFSGGTPATSTEQNPNISYATPGNYTATLVATNATGSSTSILKTITVYDNTTPGICINSETSPQNNYGRSITNVIFNEIKNTSEALNNGGYGYLDHMCSITTKVTEGETYNLSMDLTGYFAGIFGHYRVFIDYNNNGDFSDAGEEVMSGTIDDGSVLGITTRSLDIIIPTDAVENKLLRMRLIYEQGMNSVTSPCMNLSGGESEDYGVYIESLPLVLSPKVYLQGAAINPNSGEESLMRDDLRIAGLIPTATPYGDGATCNASVFNTTGNDAIVDWIWVELRDAITNTTILQSQSALLQRDGDVVSVDGTSALSFNTTADNYYVAIKHRNHLGVMSANTIGLSSTTTVVNFTNSASQITFGSNAQTAYGMFSGVVAMWSGDSNGDGVVQYTGATADSPGILTNALNDAGNFLNFPTFTVSGYSSFDVNMDGGSQYTGATADSPFILQNALAHPGNFLNFITFAITEQLP